jgi:hypothetical protein
VTAEAFCRLYKSIFSLAAHLAFIVILKVRRHPLRIRASQVNFLSLIIGVVRLVDSRNRLAISAITNWELKDTRNIAVLFERFLPVSWYGRIQWGSWLAFRSKHATFLFGWYFVRRVIIQFVMMIVIHVANQLALFGAIYFGRP